MANVSLGEYFDGYVQKQVESGRFSSASEVIRDALRLHEERERFWPSQLAALRKDIAEGIADLDAGRVSSRSVLDIIAEVEKRERIDEGEEGTAIHENP